MLCYETREFVDGLGEFLSNTGTIVDGGNPAPPWMYCALSTYQFVQDFLHQQYVCSK